MNLQRKLKIWTGTCMLMGTVLVSSCDYLDIVPPEQASLEDATKNADATLGFLHSCYAGIQNPLNYTRSEASVDEFALPQLWDHAGQKIAYDLRYPTEPRDDRWTTAYKFIGQTLLFLNELPKAQGVTEVQRAEWTAEAYFLLAYYHFEVLKFHGPCPITEHYVGEDTSPEEYGGRWHFDAVVDWLVNTLDEKVIADAHLPDSRNVNETGRVTRVAAMMLKARILLYAASPLWNGSFPYPSWTNNVETEYNGKSYGKELVSKVYDPAKWERARVANIAALETALSSGYKLYDDMNMYATEKIDLKNIYIPGGADDEFKKRVLLLRYLNTARIYEGNTEIIFGLNDSGDSFLTAAMPNRVMQLNNGSWVNGYSGLSPLLNTVDRFYMMDGNRLNLNRADLLSRANVDTNRPDIINLNVGREPRFYAWMTFDQGDYSTSYVNGLPLRVEFKDNQKQGWNQANYNRNKSVTGYLAQKFLRPSHVRTLTGTQNLKQYPRPLMRIAELYLNIAECYAQQGNTEKALEYLNPVHERAGLPAITAQQMTAQYSVNEWVRNERFIELWGEGHRYHDIRRWVKGAEYLGENRREGLNAEQMENPSFDTFNKRVKVNQPFRWSNRMYIAPIGFEESSKNLNLVQAPGY